MTLSARLLIDRIHTPVGELAIVADEAGRLRAVGFCDGHARMEQRYRRDRARRSPDHSLKNPAGWRALRRYFAGTWRDPRPHGSMEGTEFHAGVASAPQIPCAKPALRVSHADRPQCACARSAANGKIRSASWCVSPVIAKRHLTATAAVSSARVVLAKE